MQIVFNSSQRPKEYESKGGAGEYPGAPERCPHPDCRMPLVMMKNGFYWRYLITGLYTGRIRIRRYKCRVCGHTVSMLPSFCMPRYTYGVAIIIALMAAAVRSSKRKAVKEYRAVASVISRRQVGLYLSRLRQNRRFIEYGFNQISPGGAGIGDPPGDIEWTESFLCVKRAPRFWRETNAEFHKEMGKSFMSTHNKIA